MVNQSSLLITMSQTPAPPPAILTWICLCAVMGHQCVMHLLRSEIPQMHCIAWPNQLRLQHWEGVHGAAVVANNLDYLGVLKVCCTVFT